MNGKYDIIDCIQPEHGQSERSDNSELLAGDVKCRVLNGNELEPCKRLGGAAEFGNPSGKKKGIFLWRLVDMDSGDVSRQFAGAKSGDHVERGLAFNYFPFCGEKIDAPFAS